MADIKQIEQLATDWAKRTDDILLKQLKRHKVGVTEELYQSVRSRVYAAASEKFGIDLSFLLRGRFRDMGAGRGAKVESQKSNGEIIRSKSKGRTPAKWYSKPFYGRLNALQGVVSANLVEQSIKSIVDPLKTE